MAKEDFKIDLDFDLSKYNYDSKDKPSFTVDEISMLPKERITLSGESLDEFNKLINMLDEVDDVQNVYHNVEL